MVEVNIFGRMEKLMMEYGKTINGQEHAINNKIVYNNSINNNLNNNNIQKIKKKM